MSCSCVGLTPQTGGLVEASLPASGVEHMPGTTSTMGGMAHSWFDWALALIAHVSAIRAQGAVTHMLTVLIQGKLIGAFQIHSQSNTESHSDR